MAWSILVTTRQGPGPRDSHSAVLVGHKMLDVVGRSLGARAGHASVNFRSKVYVIGGVGDKKYYNDFWVLDVINSSWTQLDVMGQKPPRRFSHTAAAQNTDIVIYGGCGEDERPLNELLILQFGVEYPNGTSTFSGCRASGNTSHYDKKRFLREKDNSSVQ